MGFKHLVILGAGSTIAAIPNGDKNGIYAYTLNNFLEDPYYADFLASLDSKYQYLNIEEMCTKMYSEDRQLYEAFEVLIRKKYASLELPNEFNLLERLIMSLTADDAIVSFNWDDLIIQAYNRANQYIPEALLPKIAFPHGNAQACYNKHRYGSCRNRNNAGMIPSPLNMPIDELNYQKDLFIKSQWRILDFYMRYSQMITFFGYRGPVSDIQDLKRMEDSLRPNQICGKIEIIDRTREDAMQVAENLNSFIKLTENKADYCGSFYESRIAQYPRETLRSLDNWNYKPTSMPILNRQDFIRMIAPVLDKEQDTLDNNIEV